MSKPCKCGSYAINLHRHGRDLTDTESCDVCYWRHRAEAAVDAEREACAQLLYAAAARIVPAEARRSNEIDRHAADVLVRYGDAIRQRAGRG
jgi:hypothetical protein